MYTDEFLIFWQSYPRRIAKIAAFKAWLKALKMVSSAQELIDGAKRYAIYISGGDLQFVKHPATWLNAGCWEDEYISSQAEVSPEESRRQARMRGFEKTGFWNDDWGQRPTSH